MSIDDYYKVLNVTHDATSDEIKRNYYYLAKKWHPDRNKSHEAESRFKVIQKAYEVLSCAHSRRDYDLKMGEQNDAEEKEQEHDGSKSRNFFRYRFSSNYKQSPSSHQQQQHPSSTWLFHSSTNRFNYENGCSFNAGTTFPCNKTNFGDCCEFGANCNFPNECSFGNRCKFSSNCNFSNDCQFGSECFFGENQNFGNCCMFANRCQFSFNSNFGNNCSFGAECEGLKGNNFGNNCRLNRY